MGASASGSGYGFFASLLMNVFVILNGVKNPVVLNPSLIAKVQVDSSLRSE